MMLYSLGFYGTILIDLIHTIIKPNHTSLTSWNTVKDLFEDNEKTRVVYLEDDFSQTNLENFPPLTVFA